MKHMTYDVKVNISQTTMQRIKTISNFDNITEEQAMYESLTNGINDVYRQLERLAAGYETGSIAAKKFTEAIILAKKDTE